MPTQIDRRHFLRSATAVTAASLAARSHAVAQQSGASKAASYGDGMIVRVEEPENFEGPASAFATFLTENESFYVRNHFKQPQLKAETWSLSVDGAVAKPVQMTYAELSAMPSRTTTAMLECAGNGRVFLIPKEDGAQWQNGGMGNAEWTGVPVAEVLKRVGVQSGAVDVIFEGSDAGEMTSPDPKSPGAISFARSLPLDVAMGGGAMLAMRMNGKDLPPEHGYPVRLIVPGWYGVASVKWLKRITLAMKPFDGYFQTMQYAHWVKPNGIPTLSPVTTLGVKSAIMRPGVKEAVPSGKAYTVSGLAWAGANDIAAVEVSTDGGSTWGSARLLGSAVRDSWRMWEFAWAAPVTGSHVLMARATDSRGNVQAMERSKDFRSYEIRHVIPVKVDVR